MSILLEQMKTNAEGLSAEERAELAHELLISLDENIDSNISGTWDKEISRRVKEIKDGVAKGRSAEQVLSEIRAKYQ